MHQRVEAIFENGVLRPLASLSAFLHEHQQVNIMLETVDNHWLKDADNSITLESVRGALAKSPDTLAHLVHASREDRA